MSTPEQRAHRNLLRSARHAHLMRDIERFRVHPLPLKPTDPWEVVTASGKVGRWVAIWP